MNSCARLGSVRSIIGSSALLLAMNACNGNGTGRVVITTWGEEYIERGIPSSVFPHDQWSVEFSKFLVLYDDVTIGRYDGELGARLDHPLVFDLAQEFQGGPQVVAEFGLEAGAWQNVSYQVGPNSDRAQPAALATGSDVALLRDAGASIHVAGSATSPEGESKAFNWSFAAPTLFRRCRAEQDGRDIDGVFVTSGGTQIVELTIHGDHLFYDDLQSDLGAPRFQALANADANADGEVTMSELEDVPLYTIPLDLGTYGTGALGNVNDLGQYVRTLARTIGHYRGEGSCDSKEVIEDGSP